MKDTLTKQDFIKWAKNLLIFSTPAILAFLSALQTHDFTFALGAGYSALAASGLDLYGKYRAGVESTVINQTVSTTVTPEVKVGE